MQKRSASIAARLIVTVAKQMQTNIQRNTRKLFAAPPTLTSRAKRDCATDGKTSETNTELTNHSVGSHLLCIMVNQ